jgi:hypothetical protein
MRAKFTLVSSVESNFYVSKSFFFGVELLLEVNG